MSRAKYDEFEKIVASTDPSLGFPLISEKFMQKYVNSDVPIDRVILELNNTFTSNQGLGNQQFITCEIKNIIGDDVFGSYISGQNCSGAYRYIQKNLQQ